RGKKRLELLAQECEVGAAAILKPEREAALRAEPGDRWRHYGDRSRVRNSASKRAIQSIHDRASVQPGSALLPALQSDEVERIVAGGDARQQAEAGDRRVRLHALGLRQHVLDLSADGVG